MGVGDSKVVDGVPAAKKIRRAGRHHSGTYGVRLGIALLLAFVIGNGFMLVSSFIQYVFGYLIPLKTFIWRQLCKQVLRPFLNWLLTKPRWRRPWISNFNQRVMITGFYGSDEWKKLQGCWHLLARRLLKVRYGIEPQDVAEDEWEPLYWTLGSPTREELRGSIMMIASHAVGWSGIAAARIAPTLWNRYYLGFCLFMVLNGLIHDYYVVLRKSDLRIAGYLNIRAVLREFRRTQVQELPSQKANSEL
jgi:hypothetical protein